MHKGRLEAFSDGVLAILITIMVLEIQAPKEATWSALVGLIPKVSAYLMSFVYIGIYWNNHHHMLQSAKHVNGAVLWANLHLLFWLSLVPVATLWLANTGVCLEPVAVYGGLLLMAAIAYFILTLALKAANGQDSLLARALGKDFKGKISVVAYVVAMAVAWMSPVTSCVIYALVAVLWLVPDQRFERLMRTTASAD